jgi:hypothetical protein
LDRAKRILPEWEGLDNEVDAVRKRFEAGLPIEVQNATDNSKASHDEL